MQIIVDDWAAFEPVAHGADDRRRASTALPERMDGGPVQPAAGYTRRRGRALKAGKSAEELERGWQRSWTSSKSACEVPVVRATFRDAATRVGEGMLRCSPRRLGSRRHKEGLMLKTFLVTMACLGLVSGARAADKGESRRNDGLEVRRPGDLEEGSACEPDAIRRLHVAQGRGR